ncbi:hypothetical protein QBC40DRAFT_288800 [Triangularia verruculosa]|uniref:Uncharacterized protein n=1 Tax=Triangularia verruculosa TaxID=2587418 RepID=A0AAN7AQJ1_9PEZI|nr:hypothetical protein QBC40DRAFT_288800 [Triangularia verruculosa]
MRERQKARLQLSSLLHHHCLLWWYIDSLNEDASRLGPTPRGSMEAPWNQDDDNSQSTVQSMRGARI